MERDRKAHSENPECAFSLPRFRGSGPFYLTEKRSEIVGCGNVLPVFAGRAF